MLHRVFLLMTITVSIVVYVGIFSLYARHDNHVQYRSSVRSRIVRALIRPNGAPLIESLRNTISVKVMINSVPPPSLSSASALINEAKWCNNSVAWIRWSRRLNDANNGANISLSSIDVDEPMCAHIVWIGVLILTDSNSTLILTPLSITFELPTRLQEDTVRSRILFVYQFHQHGSLISWWILHRMDKHI